MGLPSLEIPESLLPRLADVIREGGIEVEPQPIPDGERDKILVSLLCKWEGSQLSLLLVRRVNAASSDPIFALFCPESKPGDGFIVRVTDFH
jgi:hypothetical protein